ncbi:9093_t:CDS:2 [Acaulospora colombiana]|uniref:9093_t:CDS:1 n=1 Tax=Acaulospora colombiana TaxID=27376 RepID=A0ACA9L2R1_9GLOM|nr:9093_t:CDS:2 [Acaulospora colombiana]
MPMIEHFKNFIRHGKQANQKLITQDSLFETNALDNHRINPEVKLKVDNATVAQIVAEEREQKSKIPTYPGLERYRMLEKMGDGAFSNVYKAIDTETKEKVAVKVVRKRELNYSQRSNILKEVQIMRHLKHPSIVSLISFSESSEYYYLILELMEGGPNDEPKEDEGEFIPGVGGGGIGYTAPEIVKDERYSKSVDMWALGCVLYTMLCGFPPFYDESIQELTKKVEKGQYTFLSPWWDDISFSVKDLIRHLLTVDPDQRYTIKQFFEHPWINDKPLHAKPPVDTKVTTRSIDVNQLTRGIERSVMFEDILGSPGENGRRKDMLSPGISLKEIFDVGYAVHRMEEEGARKRKVKMGGGKFGALNPFKNKIIHQMNDDDDLSDDDGESSSQVSSREVASAPNESLKIKAGTKSNERSRRTTIELNLDGATLLGRRRKVPVGA